MPSEAKKEQLREEARDDFKKYCMPDVGEPEDVFSLRPRCCHPKPSHDWMELINRIEAKGTVVGDCGACPRQNEPLYINLCHRCTLVEIHAAIDSGTVGALQEKYGI